MGQRWSKKYGRVQRFSFLGDRMNNLTHTQMPSAIIDPWVDKTITCKYIHTSESTRYINPTYQIYSNIFKYHVRSVKLSLLQKFNTFPPFSTIFHPSLYLFVSIAPVILWLPLAAKVGESGPSSDRRSREASPESLGVVVMSDG